MESESLSNSNMKWEYKENTLRAKKDDLGKAVHLWHMNM